MRLSRKVLVGLAGLGGAAVLGATIWALDSGRRHKPASPELVAVDGRQTAEGLQALPKDYLGFPGSDVPKLGPPLPGELGRPIRRAQEQGKPVEIPAIATPRADPDEQRRLAENEAARVAKLFVDTHARERSLTLPPAASVEDGSRERQFSANPSHVDSGTPRDAQESRLGFVNAEPDRRTVSPDRLSGLASPYVVQAGTIIPAALVTGIRSDLPGMITAQVTEPVFDSVTGEHLLIPQGSRLIGEYDSRIAFGQRRVLPVWTRLILPDGDSIVLERLPGTDTQGFSGLEDKVDYHWGQLFRAAALSTLLGVGSELGSSGENEIAKAIRESAQGTVTDIGGEIVRRQLDVQPTLTVRPGFAIRIVVRRDLVLAPYGTPKEPS